MAATCQGTSLVSTLQSLFLHISYLSNEDAASFSAGRLGRMRIFLECVCILTKSLMKRAFRIAYVYYGLDALNLFPATHASCILYF